MRLSTFCGLRRDQEHEEYRKVHQKYVRFEQNIFIQPLDKLILLNSNLRKFIKIFSQKNVLLIFFVWIQHITTPTQRRRRQRDIA
jgi:hypothetical protein